MGTPVDIRGFAYIEDLIYVLGDYGRYYLPSPPSVGDIIYVIVHLDSGRFQGASLSGTGTPYDILVRCCHGQGDGVARQMDHEFAHKRVSTLAGIPLLVHYTRSEYLMNILGRPDAQGLIPRGGIDRADVHCSTSVPADGILPERFRKKGIDCAICLDWTRMFRDDVRVYISSGRPNRQW